MFTKILSGRRVAGGAIAGALLLSVFSAIPASAGGSPGGDRCFSNGDLRACISRPGGPDDVVHGTGSIMSDLPGSDVAIAICRSDSVECYGYHQGSSIDFPISELNGPGEYVTRYYYTDSSGLTRMVESYPLSL